MQKHAYMIIAHNEFDLLEILVRLLDDPRNDIYVHIDAKVKDFDFKSFQALTQYSRLRFTPRRISATWGDFSLIQSCSFCKQQWQGRIRRSPMPITI